MFVSTLSTFCPYCPCSIAINAITIFINENNNKNETEQTKTPTKIEVESGHRPEKKQSIRKMHG